MNPQNDQELMREEDLLDPDYLEWVDKILDNRTEMEQHAMGEEHGRRDGN